jgi:hypothetical protein
MRGRAVFAALAALLATGAALRAADRPNVVFILADDLGWADLGCYGSRYHKTPHLDRLAASALRFTDAYAACPVCSPTRAAIMTGRYPARLNLTDWLPGRPDRPDQKPLRPAINQDFPAGVTLPEARSYFAPFQGKDGTFMPGLQEAPDGEYLTDRLTAEAEKFIEANK